jgi:hypothetical protein
VAEPDNIMLEHLKAIRAELAEIKRDLAGKASAAQVAELDRNLTGLSHLVLSGFGSVVQRLESIDQRVAVLERQRV